MRVIVISNNNRPNIKRHQDSIDATVKNFAAAGWTVHSAVTTTTVVRQTMVPTLEVTTTIVFV